MKPTKLTLAVAILAAFVTSPTHAACEVGRAMQNAADQAAKSQTDQAQKDAQAVLTQAKQQQTCLDQIANTDITASAGLPNVGDVLKAIKGAAAQQACNVAIGEINKGVGAANGAINQTGINQIPGIGANVGINNSGTVQTTTQDTSAQATGGVWDKIKSIFR